MDMKTFVETVNAKAALGALRTYRALRGKAREKGRSLFLESVSFLLSEVGRTTLDRASFVRPPSGARSRTERLGEIEGTARRLLARPSSYRLYAYELALMAFVAGD